MSVREGWRRARDGTERLDGEAVTDVAWSRATMAQDLLVSRMGIACPPTSAAQNVRADLLRVHG
jgi:hypothetical protein